MAKVARLNVMITASSKGLATGVAKAQAALGRLNVAAMKSRTVLGNAVGKGAAMAVARGASIISGAASKMGSIVTGAVAGIGIASTAAAAGLVALTKAQMASVDVNAKAARMLGVTFNELKALQLAASRAGIGMEEVTKGFEDMLAIVGEASTGSQSAIDIFKQLGLSFEDIKRMNPAQQFTAITSAINRLPNPADRIGAARKFFSDQGGPLLELFRGGGAAIQQATKDVNVFGLALSEIQTSQIEAANDKFKDMKEILTGVGTQLAAIVAPVMEQISIDAKEWVESMGGVGPIVDGVLTKLEEKLFTIEAWTTSIADGFGMIYAAAKKAERFLPGGRAAQIGRSVAGDGAGALYNYGQADIKGRKNRLENPNAVKGGKRGGPKGVIPAIRGYVANAEAESKNRALEAQQDDINAPRVEAAQQQRQAEQRAMYEREQYRKSLEQQEAMRRLAGAQRRGFAPAVPLGGGGPLVPDSGLRMNPGIKYKTGESYKSKIPTGAPGYADKVPTGTPNYQMKVPDAIPNYLSKTPGAQQGEKTDRQMAILEQIARNTAKNNVAYAG